MIFKGLKPGAGNSRRYVRLVFILPALILLFGTVCEAVTSTLTRHSSSEDFLKGEVNDVVIGSRGTIQLGRASEVLVKEFENVWSINSIVVIGDTVYLGTSPNGGVYGFGPAGLEKVYSAEIVSEPEVQQKVDTIKDANEPNDSNEIQADKHLANEHIFAMAADVTGRLLVGISGKRCVLCRFEGDEMKVIYEPNDAQYIFAIAVDKAGDIYIGTGPEGKIYRLDSSGKNAGLIYDSPDKNILSLAMGPNDFIYAGSDSKGLIYRINTRAKEASVLYDSDQQEITALLFFGEDIYAAATSAAAIQQEQRFVARPPQAGRPETQPEDEPGEGVSGGGLNLQIANTKKGSGEKEGERKAQMPRPPKPTKASYIYKVTKDGFVTDIFHENAVFFCLAAEESKFLLGTGNNAQLYEIEPASEEQAIIYENRQASQLTAVSVRGDEVYIGTANPARLIKMGKSFASEGTYSSELVDAGQPAKWGKLQIEADVPEGCKVLASSRSGNVKDVNDPSFSQWTELKEITGPIQMECPAGRFCQYKLVLRGDGGVASPVVREVAVASIVPNLAPRVRSVSVERIEAGDKNGVFKIGYKVDDDNSDKLIYTIDFRKLGRTGWIEIKNDIEGNTFEWDGKTVEDGRYEIRVTASDERSNTPETKLTGSRVSEAIVVDNTGPVVELHTISRAGGVITLKMIVSDELSAIGKVEYTIDSNEKWKGVVPDDSVYDTTSEDVTIVVEGLPAGEHVIALKLADDIGNTTYKSVEVNIEAN